MTKNAKQLGEVIEYMRICFSGSAAIAVGSLVDMYERSTKRSRPKGKRDYERRGRFAAWRDEMNVRALAFLDEARQNNTTSVL
jgi:hypothetical protein